MVGDPNFKLIDHNVLCNISATNILILDFDSAFEPPDPQLSFPGSEIRIE